MSCYGWHTCACSEGRAVHTPHIGNKQTNHGANNCTLSPALPCLATDDRWFAVFALGDQGSIMQLVLVLLA